MNLRVMGGLYACCFFCNNVRYFFSNSSRIAAAVKIDQRNEAFGFRFLEQFRKTMDESISPARENRETYRQY
jgi:hypothetical protein